MKKLILLVLLIFSINVVAQKQQIIKNYTTAVIVTPEGERSEWLDIDTRIFFHYSGQSDKVKIYLKDNVLLLTQISDTFESQTVGGMSYYQLELRSDSGEILFMQVFKDEQYGVRFIFDDLSSIQVTN